MEKHLIAQATGTRTGKPLNVRARIWLVGAALCLVGTLAAAQVFEQREFQSPQHEQRYRALVDELRCLVCQNQNLADSNAPLAADLRNIVFDMIENRKSDDEIRAFMVQRYGDFVLYRPPFAAKNAALWAGPFILLVTGLWLLIRQVRRRAATGSTGVQLDNTERQALRTLLGEPPDETKRGSVE